MNMVDRAVLLSHPKYHAKNLEFIINTFVLNDYPLDFIFYTINSRLRTSIKKRVISNNKTYNTDEKIHWFTVPYFQNISEKFKNFLISPNIKLAFYSLNKLDSIIKGHKDPLSNHSKKNVVYKILCKDCDATYWTNQKKTKY